MKVLMFGWEFPPHISGGLGTACQGIVRGLVQNGVDVALVVPKTYGDEHTEKFRLVDAGKIPLDLRRSSKNRMREVFSCFEVNSPVVPYLSPDEYWQGSYKEDLEIRGKNQPSEPQRYYAFSGMYGKDLLSEVWNYALIGAEIARLSNFDVVHAHDWLSFPAAIMAKKVSKKPLIVHVHATEFDRSGCEINRQVFEIERQGMMAADKVIAVSEFTRGILIDKYGMPPGKVIAIHNAVEACKWEKEQKGPVKFREKIISYLGRVTFQKGPEYFIEAASKVLRKDSGFRFVMGGSGNMLNRMVEMAARLRISSRFHFTGFLEGDMVQRLLSQSHAYVMPSVSEPFGISPLEAVQQRVPVIISKQSGVQEVLKNAIKIDFWDTDAMANAIHAVASYKALAGILSREGIREVKQFSWERQSGLIKSLYQTILK